MYLPKMTLGKVTREELRTFGALNRTNSPGEGEFAQMENISPRRFPCLSPREKRGKINISLQTGEQLHILGMLAKENLAFVADLAYPPFETEKYYTCSGTAGNEVYAPLCRCPVDWGENNTDYYRLTEGATPTYTVLAAHNPVFFYGGERITALNGYLQGGARRKLVSMGANIVIFPDKVMYNTLTGAVTPLEASTGTLTGAHLTPANPMELSLCDGEGNANFAAISGVSDTVGNTYIGTDTPTDVYQTDENGNPATTLLRALKNGEYWIDTSGDTPVLKVYSDALGQWSAVATAYVKISHSSLKSGENCIFKAGDGIVIEGLSHDTLNGSRIVSAAGVENGKGWIAVPGVLNTVTAQEMLYQIVALNSFAELAGLDTADTPANALKIVTVGNGIYRLQNGAWSGDNSLSLSAYSRTVSLRRPVPDMDFTVENKNRLWGCRYDGNVNEIYACKLGDPTNWYCYQGIASDSYAVSLGSDGAFTGAVAYDDSVLFFKENAIHRIYGSKPANFQVVTVAARGIEKNSARSAVICNETLYYLGKAGVMAYNGGTPVCISGALNSRFADGAAGALNDRYYICMTDTVTGERGLYCFYLATGGWYREDGANADCFAALSENLYAAGGGELVALNGESYDGILPLAAREGDVPWSAETGDMGMSGADEKYYGFFTLRLEAEAGAALQIAVQYNSDGIWHEKYVCRPHRKRMLVLPFVTPRCDHLRLRISGRGDCTLYSVTKSCESGGSDLHGTA